MRNGVLVQPKGGMVSPGRNGVLVQSEGGMASPGRNGVLVQPEGGMVSPGRNGVLVQPEGDPGHDDQHAAGHVDGDQVVGELTLEDQLHLQAAVLACTTQYRNLT